MAVFLRNMGACLWLASLRSNSLLRLVFIAFIYLFSISYISTFTKYNFLSLSFWPCGWLGFCFAIYKLLRFRLWLSGALSGVSCWVFVCLGLSYMLLSLARCVVCLACWWVCFCSVLSCVMSCACSWSIKYWLKLVAVVCAYRVGSLLCVGSLGCFVCCAFLGLYPFFSKKFLVSL